MSKVGYPLHIPSPRLARVRCVHCSLARPLHQNHRLRRDPLAATGEQGGRITFHYRLSYESRN